MSADTQWMPLYIGDYHRDTGHLTVLEHGAYLLLLMQAWTRKGVLPHDEKRLAALARCSPRQWAECREAVLAFFEKDDEGYRNKRLDRELARASAISEERRKAGATGAAKRWAKDAKPVANAMANAMAEPSQPEWQNDAQLHLQPQLQKKVRPTPSESPSSGVDFDDFWAAYPRKVGKDAARKAFASALKRASVADIAAGLNAARWPSERQFIPHPATWLNAGRWQDDPTDAAPEPAGKLDWLHDLMTSERMQ
jgi:uncharacterized protein YdaU (DUF1376 family)